ncbi:MAG: hypothetical protein ACRC11_07885 [Xenococcaceae cyanobacterium]
MPSATEDFANGTSQRQNQPTNLTEKVSCWPIYTTKLAEVTSKSTHACQFTLSWSCQVLEHLEVMQVAQKFIHANWVSELV